MIRSEPAPWRQPVVGGARHPGLLALSGRDRVRLSEERRVLAPLSVLLGIEETVGDDQRTVAASLPVTDWLEHDGGSLPEGVLTVLCDTVLGSAVHVTLAPGESMATTWLSMSCSPMPRPTGRLHARSQLVQRLGDTAVSRAEVLDDRGHLAAVASCRVLITSTPVGDGPTAVPEPQVQQRIAPWQQFPRADAPGGVKHNQDGLGRLLALEETDGWLGRQTEFLGLQLTAAMSGMVRCSMPATGWLTSSAGTVQGGAGAWLGLAASRAAVCSTLAADEDCRITDCSVAYARPVTASDGLLRAEASVERRGRRVAVVACTVFDEESRPALMITASSSIFPASALPASAHGTAMAEAVDETGQDLSGTSTG